jgi:Phytanoyl-CoA dioxygenase (PhyH)
VRTRCSPGIRIRHIGSAPTAKVHTIATALRDGDEVVAVPIRRGDITVHNEGVLHGSGGNTSATSWRRAYIVALRSVDTVKQERALGFTHSHNDSMDLLDNVDGLQAAREEEKRSDSHKE